MIRIDTIEGYELCRANNFEPLIDDKFDLDINVRVDIQKRLFGDKPTPEGNEKFYRWCWEHLAHRCAETMRPLDSYSSVHVSHILTRGAHPDMCYDPRNVNILSLEAHNRWENGERRNMRIYSANQRTIDKLKAEYQKLK